MTMHSHGNQFAIGLLGRGIFSDSGLWAINGGYRGRSNGITTVVNTIS